MASRPSVSVSSRLSPCVVTSSVSWLFLMVALLSASPLAAQSVLNTERVDPQAVSGFFTRLETETTVQRGNADVIDLKGSAAVGYRARHSWVLLVGGLSYLSSSDSLSTDDRYLQVRWGRFLTPQTRTFHFVQIQNSHEQALTRRFLVGSGVRHTLARSDRNRLDLGVGVMWEAERLDARKLPPGSSTSSRDWRGDFIGFAAHRLSSTSRLTDMLYFEPRIDAPADTRLLNELRLSVSAARNVELAVGLHWLHDSRPPASVGRDDVQLNTSLSLTVM